MPTAGLGMFLGTNARRLKDILEGEMMENQQKEIEYTQ